MTVIGPVFCVVDRLVIRRELEAAELRRALHRQREHLGVAAAIDANGDGLVVPRDRGPTFLAGVVRDQRLPHGLAVAVQLDERALAAGLGADHELRIRIDLDRVDHVADFRPRVDHVPGAEHRRPRRRRRTDRCRSSRAAASATTRSGRRAYRRPCSSDRTAWGARARLVARPWPARARGGRSRRTR